MGAQLVTHVLMRWTHVPDRAFRLLVRMAHTALDTEQNGIPAGHYFGGRELLAATLPPAEGTHQTRLKTVQRALADLVTAGAIRRVGGAGPRRNQVYELTLTTQRRTPTVPHSIDTSPVDNALFAVAGPDPMEDTQSPPVGDSGSPSVGDTRSPKWGTPTVPPMNKEEPLEELSEEPTPSPTATHPRPQAPPQHTPNDIPDDCCPACGTLLDPDRHCRTRTCPTYQPLAA